MLTRLALARDVLLSGSARTLCHACLATVLGVGYAEAREIAFALRLTGEVALAPARCDACARRRLVVRADGQLPDVLTRAVRWLAHHRGRPYCAGCLAEEIHCVAAEATQAVDRLARVPGLEGRVDRCARCGRRAPVVGASPARPPVAR